MISQTRPRSWQDVEVISKLCSNVETLIGDKEIRGERVGVRGRTIREDLTVLYSVEIWKLFHFRRPAVEK